MSSRISPIIINRFSNIHSFFYSSPVSYLRSSSSNVPYINKSTFSSILFSQNLLFSRNTFLRQSPSFSRNLTHRFYTTINTTSTNATSINATATNATATNATATNATATNATATNATSNTTSTSNSEHKSENNETPTLTLEQELEEEKRQKFWELWNEEVEATKEGKEYTPKPIPIIKETRPSLLRALMAFLLIHYILQWINEHQVDQKQMTNLVEKKFEEVLERIKPFVQLTCGEEVPPEIFLKIESRRYTFLAEDRYFVFVLKFYDNHHFEFSFSPFERSFVASGSVNLNLLVRSNDEENPLKNLDLPMKCQISVVRRGRSVKLVNLTTDFLKCGKRVTIPTEIKPSSEYSWYWFSVPHKE